MTSHDDQLGTVTEILRDTRIAVLTYQSAEGTLVSTPMGTQDFETPSTVWFITERDTDLIGKRQRPLRPRRIVAHQADWLIKSPIFVQTELPLHPPGEAPIMTFPRPILCHIGRFQTLDFQRVSL